MIYLFHGEDVVACEEALAQLLAEAVPPEALDMALTRLEGGGLTMAGLIEHCEALPFLSPKRIVVVEGLAGRVESKGRGQESGFLKQLRDYLPRLAGTTVLVLRERTALPGNHPLVTMVQKVGEVRAFAPPRGRELSRWIAQQVQREGCEITPAAADLLAATAGTDPALLRQEVAKLATYVGAQGRIDERLVAELASAGRLSDIFDLVDAIGQRRRAQAMVELRRLLDAGQHPLYILTMVVRQFRLLLQVKALPAGDRRPDVVARTIRVHPYVADKIASQAQAFRREELEQIYHRLVAADQEVKTGKRDGEVALELLVVEVAGR
jgi:DNA polymerase-3 subunit delta